MIKNHKEKIKNIVKSTNFDILLNYDKKYGFKDIEESYWYEFSDKTFR